ncbi:protein of unknown function [Lactiplantibacillus plantarum]
MSKLFYKITDTRQLILVEYRLFYFYLTNPYYLLVRYFPQANKP